MIRILFSALLLITFNNSVFSQNEETEEKVEEKDSTRSATITALPVLFFLPETSLGFGGLGITTFNIGKEKSWRPSQVLLSFAYTLKKQILIFAPYELYYKQKWKTEGEIGYYKYFFNYYGIGNDSKEENLEFFDADFPRFINTVSYRIIPSNFIGFRAHFDSFKLKNRDSLLIAENQTGIDGGVLFSTGLVYTVDTRDDIFYPRKGVNFHFGSEFSSTKFGSDFDCVLLELTASHYWEVAKNHIIASNITSGSILGDPPFFEFPYVSSSKLARGHADRRFTDKSLGVVQAEYRFPIYKRLRGAAFGAIGNVGENYGAIFQSSPKLSGGAGLRFQLNKKVMNHIRLDVAGSREGVQFYVTFGESF